MSWLTQLSQELTTSEKVALIGVATIWVVYRLGQRSERRGVIRGLENELDMHRYWVGTAYSADKRGSWPFSHMVFKLATVAVDNAIARGPSLFLNKELTTTLVRYRQEVSHLNQLIDRTMEFQANPELWATPPPPSLVDHAKQLVDGVHIDGIGDVAANTAHAHFQRVLHELDRERDSKVLPIIWAVMGLNLFFLKSLGKWV